MIPIRETTWMWCDPCGDAQESHRIIELEPDWATIRQTDICLTCGYQWVQLLPIVTQQDEHPA